MKPQLDFVIPDFFRCFNIHFAPEVRWLVSQITGGLDVGKRVASRENQEGFGCCCFFVEVFSTNHWRSTDRSGGFVSPSRRVLRVPCQDTSIGDYWPPIPKQQRESGRKNWRAESAATKNCRCVLGGGFKYFFLPSLFGEGFHFD